MYRVTTVATGSEYSLLTTVTGGELSIATTTKDLTPPAETVEAGERFELFFDDGVNIFGNGLCSVVVTYRRSTAPTTPTRPAIEQAALPVCERDEFCRVESP